MSLKTQIRKENICKLLKIQIEKLKASTDKNDFDNIFDDIFRNLKNIYGENSQEVADVAYSENKGKLINILEGIIQQIELIGLPEPAIAEDKSINFTNNTNVHQTQNININLSTIINKEIPQGRIDDIKEILNSKENEKTKFQKVAEVIRTCGIEVTSSTLAKIITQLLGV
ncbi:MAG: hypothetical protein WCY19_02660 [Candidatus Gastranaerophilaceae bacterium]